MRVSPCRKKKSEIINKHLTWGRVYRVIGIESDYYRIVDDQGMPVLFPPDWFNIIDDEEPKCWITSYSEDGDRYSYPNELNAVGFFEDWHNEDAEARRVFREYLSKYLMDIVKYLQPIQIITM